MTVWDAAVIALLPAFAIPVLAGLRGSTADRVAAGQLAGSVAMIVLALMTFLYGQDSFIDLALALPLVSLAGTLAVALFLERWL